MPREAGVTATAEKLADYRAYARLTIDATVDASYASATPICWTRSSTGPSRPRRGNAHALGSLRPNHRLSERAQQFGQVIGSFQGLKHRAADLFGEIEQPAPRS